jgi:hypothetical protein
MDHQVASDGSDLGPMRHAMKHLTTGYRSRVGMQLGCGSVAAFSPAFRRYTGLRRAEQHSASDSAGREQHAACCRREATPCLARAGRGPLRPPSRSSGSVAAVQDRDAAGDQEPGSAPCRLVARWRRRGRPRSQPSRRQRPRSLVGEAVHPAMTRRHLRPGDPASSRRLTSRRSCPIPALDIPRADAQPDLAASHPPRTLAPRLPPSPQRLPLTALPLREPVPGSLRAAPSGAAYAGGTIRAPSCSNRCRSPALRQVGTASPSENWNMAVNTCSTPAAETPKKLSTRSGSRPARPPCRPPRPRRPSARFGRLPRICRRPSRAQQPADSAGRPVPTTSSQPRGRSRQNPLGSQGRHHKILTGPVSPCSRDWFGAGLRRHHATDAPAVAPRAPMNSYNTDAPS